MERQTQSYALNYFANITKSIVKGSASQIQHSGERPFCQPLTERPTIQL